ncbi:MAG: hypothetical protein ABH827_01275, partial [bacterium]
MLTKKNSSVLFFVMFFFVHNFCFSKSTEEIVAAKNAYVDHVGIAGKISESKLAEPKNAVSQKDEENYFSYLLTALKNITYQTEQVIISLPKMPQDEIVIDLTCAGSGDLLS